MSPYSPSCLLSKPPRGVTLIELLVTIAIVSLLAALVLPAVQTGREAARRLGCSNKLRGIASAAQNHHNVWNRFPPGVSSDERHPGAGRLAWGARLLPFIEQRQLWEACRLDYHRQRNPFVPIPHSSLSVPISMFACPSEGRAESSQWARNRYVVGLTDYLGVAGVNYASHDGVLFLDSEVRLRDIGDGASNTLLVGERPPSPDNWFGWWYAGYGQEDSGVPDMLLGVRERNIGYDRFVVCPETVYEFRMGEADDFCDALHFWSWHPGGAQFAFADGGVRFLAYESNETLPKLATRMQHDY